MKKNKIFSLISFLAISYAIAICGSFATQASLDPWYASLERPSWNPPAWVFGPVWTFLYFLIAVAGWLLFLCKKSKFRNRALLFYFLQLLFNFLWSFLFFYFQSPLLGLIDILLLTLFIGLTLHATWVLSKRAFVLLTPYFVWTVYAVTLNVAIYLLNQ